MPRGGSRVGAGRPSKTGKYGEPTKAIRIPLSMEHEVLDLIQNKSYLIPLYSSHISAGFPSPADDHLATKLDLNQHLIKNPSASFFLKVSGDSMVGAGIYDGDLLVVDRSIEAKDGKVIIAAVDGQLTVKRLREDRGKKYLMPENSKYQAIEIKEEQEVIVWGVVTNVIHKV